MSPSTVNLIATQAGAILLVAPAPKICLTAFVEEGKLLRTTLRPAPAFQLEFADDGKSEVLKEQLFEWMRAYASGFPALLPLQQPAGFFGKALEAICAVPFGKTCSYSEIAQKAGNPRAARAAGTACRRNPFPLLIPCHRILPQSGKLGNYLFGLEMKAELLDFESRST